MEPDGGDMTDRATAILMDEHRIIEKVVLALPHLADALERGDAVDLAKLEGLVPFMREFADGCHHAKEEDILFPTLLKNGLPTKGGPVQVMCAEHETGREFVSRLENAVSVYRVDRAQGAEILAAVLRDIASLYMAHIRKEDGVLFPMAEQLLGKEKATKLIAEFNEVDARQVATRERCVLYAEKFAL